MIIERFIDYFRKDVVLAVSFVLAVISCIITPPNAGYADYIDFNTLIMLFCLMLIVEGLRRQNVFLYGQPSFETGQKTSGGCTGACISLLFCQHVHYK